MNSKSENQLRSDVRLSPTSLQLEKIARQLARIDEDEQITLRRVLNRTIQLDDELADLHLTLPTLEISFYLLDNEHCECVPLTPQQLLVMLKTSGQVETDSVSWKDGLHANL